MPPISFSPVSFLALSLSAVTQTDTAFGIRSKCDAAPLQFVESGFLKRIEPNLHNHTRKQNILAAFKRKCADEVDKLAPPRHSNAVIETLQSVFASLRRRQSINSDMVVSDSDALLVRIFETVLARNDAHEDSLLVFEVTRNGATEFIDFTFVVILELGTVGLSLLNKMYTTDSLVESEVRRPLVQKIYRLMQSSIENGSNYWARKTAVEAFSKVLIEDLKLQMQSLSRATETVDFTVYQSMCRVLLEPHLDFLMTSVVLQEDEAQQFSLLSKEPGNLSDAADSYFTFRTATVNEIANILMVRSSVVAVAQYDPMEKIRIYFTDKYGPEILRIFSFERRKFYLDSDSAAVLSSKKNYYPFYWASLLRTLYANWNILPTRDRVSANPVHERADFLLNIVKNSEEDSRIRTAALQTIPGLLGMLPNYVLDVPPAAIPAVEGLNDDRKQFLIHSCGLAAVTKDIADSGDSFAVDDRMLLFKILYDSNLDTQLRRAALSLLGNYLIVHLPAEMIPIVFLYLINFLSLGLDAPLFLGSTSGLREGQKAEDFSVLRSDVLTLFSKQWKIGNWSRQNDYVVYLTGEYSRLIGVSKKIIEKAYHEEF